MIGQLLTILSSDWLVQARNRFGWSDASRLFTFFTSTKGEDRDLAGDGARQNYIGYSVCGIIW